MIKKTVYLDHASTTKISDKVLEAMLPYLKEEYGNPSSLYSIGISNKKIINNCRKKIASFINANPKEIYFCSCGSEANNWAIKGIAFKHQKHKEIITTKIEHHSVLNSCLFLEKLGYKVHYLDVDEEGFVDINELDKMINDNTILVSVMMANNEIGTIQNIKEIGKLCKAKKVYFHTDAIQAINYLSIDVEELNIDLMSISAHKFYGPKGIGFLYIREGVEIENLIHGGKQEKEKRAGTENIAYIVGLTKAFELTMQNREKEVIKERELTKYLFNELQAKIKDIKLNGPKIGDKRLPGNLNLSFKNLDGEILSYQLNKHNVFVSTGSACNEGVIGVSHVLKAINVPASFIKGTIRISLGKDTTIDDINYFIKVLLDIISN